MIRQQVVEFAALDIAVARLTEPTRRLLSQLSVLQQPFPLLAIEQGLETPRSVWQPLLDWSLLRFNASERTYRLHSLTKQYAEPLLEEQERTCLQTQFGTWYERYADHESHQLNDYLEAHRFYRAAGEKVRAGTLVMQMADVLRRYGLYPLLRTLCITTFNDVQEDDTSLTARCLHEMGNVAYLQGDYAEARRLYGQSLAIEEELGDQSGKANSLGQLGTLAYLQGDYAEARRLYGQSLASFEELGELRGKAIILHQMGMIAQDQGGYAEARRLYGQSLAIEEELGELSGKASSLHQMGMIAQDQGDYVEARRLYGQSLAIKEELGDLSGKASSFGQLGMLAYLQENIEEALDFTIQAFLLFERLHSPNRTLAQKMLVRIRSRMDEQSFLAHWKAIAGDHPLPLLTEEDTTQSLIQTLIAFIQTPTWDASQQFLEAHTELLAPDIDSLLEQLAFQQGDDQARQSIATHRQLLQRCREVGIAAAFAELMNAATEQNNAENPTVAPASENESEAFSLADLPRVVATVIQQGTQETCQQIATALVEVQHGLSEEHAAVSDLLGCFVSRLHGEMPDTSVLTDPFIELWQEFETLLGSDPKQSGEQEKKNG